LDGYNRLFAFAVSSHEAKVALGDRLPEFIAERPWLRKAGLTGYSLRQAFSENDLAYAAALGLAKATHDLVDREKEKYSAKLCFAFPIIVVETPLIRCVLAEDGEVLLEEVDQGEFLFHAGSAQGLWHMHSSRDSKELGRICDRSQTGRGAASRRSQE
jgi:hypothetical protein